MFHLRSQLSETTNDPSFKEVEKDPSEFLRALEALFRYAPLKTIPPGQSPNATASSVTTNIMCECCFSCFCRFSIEFSTIF